MKKFYLASTTSIYLFVTFIVTWPVVLSPNSRILGYAGDSTGTIYDIWAQKTFGLRIVGEHLVSWRGFPFGFSQDYTPSISNSLTTLSSYALSHITGEIMAYNILIAVGIIGSAYSMYWAARKLGCDQISSTWAGFAFTMFPFHQLAAGGWVSQVQFFPIPISIALGYEFVNEISAKRFRKLVVILAIAAITNAYVFLIVLAIVIGTLVFVLKPLTTSFLSKRLKVKVLLSSITLVLVSVLLFLAISIEIPIRRSSTELDVFGLRIIEILRPTELARLLPSFVPRTNPSEFHGSNITEVSQFVGYTTISLALYSVLLVLRKREQKKKIFYFSFLLVVGIWVGASQGFELCGISLPNPAESLGRIAPYWRAYSRFGVLIMAALVLIAANGLSRMTENRRKPVAIFILLSVCTLTFLELWSPLPGKTTKFVSPSYLPSLQDPQIESIAMYPIVPDGHLVAYEQIFWQRLHKKKLLNGGPPTSDSYEFQMSVSNIESKHISQALTQVGIDAVVLDKNAYRLVYGREPLVNDKGFQIIFNDTSFSVFKILKQEIPIAVWPSGVQATELSNDGVTWRWTGTEFTINYQVSRPGCYKLEFSIPRFQGAAEIFFSRGNWSSQITSGYSRSIDVYLDSTSQKISAKSDSETFTLEDGRKVVFYLSDIVPSYISERCN